MSMTDRQAAELMFAEPVTAICPSACCFNQLCSTHLQEEAVRTLWVEGSKREDCTWFELLAKTHKQETSFEPPATADELFEQREERRALQAADAPETTPAPPVPGVDPDAEFVARIQAKVAGMRETAREQRINATGQNELRLGDGSP